MNVAGDREAGKVDFAEKPGGRQTRTEIWKDVLEALVDPASGMDEAERANYEQKIMQKLKSGKRLTAEELEYLRIHNPELYRIAARVEKERRVFKSKLGNCKSKEEVQQVISVEMEVLKAMKGNPAQEYMAAMVKKEVQDFKKTSEYARLPQKREEGEEKKGKEKLPQEDENGMEEDGVLFYKASAYGRLQVQCNVIGALAQSCLSA